MAEAVAVTVTNTLDAPLVVYVLRTAKPLSIPPSADPDAYSRLHAKAGVVPANGSATLDVQPDAGPRLLIARETDVYPIRVVALGAGGAQSVTVGAADVAAAQSSQRFWQDALAQPYASVALQFIDLVMNPANFATMDAQASALLATAGYAGASLAGVAEAGRWMTNVAYGIAGAYQAYSPSPLGAGAASAGVLTIGRAAVSFAASDGGASYPALQLSEGTLRSNGATPTSGLVLIGFWRAMAWEGQPGRSGMFWIGTRDGKLLIAQPQAGAGVPWWIAAFNQAFSVSLALRVAATADMVLSVVSDAQWLAANAPGLIKALRSELEAVSATADPDAAAGADVIAVTIDVDIDTELNTDTDTDTDTDINIDTDNIIGVFTEVHTVEVTENVIDNVSENVSDTAIDTDIDVAAGDVVAALRSLGGWIAGAGFAALSQNLVLSGAMTGALQLADQLASGPAAAPNLSPQETTGLGLLLNYMLNEQVGIDARWNTFADFVQAAQPSVTSQKLILACLMMFGDDPADRAAGAWVFPAGQMEGDIVPTLTPNRSPAQQPQAYRALATLAANQRLPVKVVTRIAIMYLDAIG